MSPRRALRWALCACLPLAALVGAEAAPLAGQAHAGYVYPAGGRAGTTLRVAIGGQNLRSADAVRITGGGVTGEIKLWVPPPRNIDGEESRAIRTVLAEARRRLRAGGTAVGRGEPLRVPEERVRIKGHPYLQDLETRTADELDEIEDYFFRRRNPLQRKRSIEETLWVQLTVAPDAQPGMRDLRVQTRVGLSTPVRFRVGRLPEHVEKEPNDDGWSRLGVLDLPATVNGQILPRDVDRFRIRARRGQRLVARVEARALVPFQADSVPGWMQATVALHDPDGREVAYADDYRFDPDPVLFYEVPEDGEYELVIRDAIMRGREDFVYRVSVGELPFVTQVFPLGGRASEACTLHVEGWNLDRYAQTLEMPRVGSDVREAVWFRGELPSNEVLYAVDDLPEVEAREPDDEPKDALEIELPRVVNGRIEREGDVDHVRFRGHLGDEVAVEVQARALGSPLDALLRVFDEDGQVVAWNDDPTPGRVGVRAYGLQTHEADPSLRVKLPRSGTFTVQVSDVRGVGGPDHAYRLRIEAPQPRAQVFVSPSNLNARAGERVALTAWAVRRDGYDGEIELALVEPPAGFALESPRIPAGRFHAKFTMMVPPSGGGTATTLRFVARMRDGRGVVERPCTPADDVMQAFLWRHLLPAQETTAFVLEQRAPLPAITYDASNEVRVSRGGSGRARFETPGRFEAEAYAYQLVDPPAGLSIRGVKRAGRDFVVEIQADRKDAEKDDRVEHLLIEVFTKPGTTDDARRRGKRRRQPPPAGTSLGYLPVVPCRIR